MSNPENYFKQLNYTLANEDTSFEHAILPEGVSSVVSVAGSGSRVIPLLARKPKILRFVDLVPEQLFLAQARVEAVRAFTHDEFLSFFGYPGASNDTTANRKALFERLDLTSKAKESLRARFEALEWGTLLYEGKWEQTFAKLSKVNGKITGSAGRGLFECRTLKEQKDYLATKFPYWKWRAVLAIIGNAGIFNALLYRGSFPKKNIPQTFLEFYRERFQRLFDQDVARKNYFLQLCFFGKIQYPEGVLIEANPDVFSDMKKGLATCEIRYENASIIDAVKNAKEPVEFVSLSDVPSYFSGELEREYLQTISPGLAPGALVVLRSYLHRPENMNVSGYKDVTQEFAGPISQEKVQVYDIEVFKKI